MLSIAAFPVWLKLNATFISEYNVIESVAMGPGKLQLLLLVGVMYELAVVTSLKCPPQCSFTVGHVIDLLLTHHLCTFVPQQTS